MLTDSTRLSPAAETWDRHRPPDLNEAERSLFREVEAYKHAPRLADLNAERMRSIVAERGLDFATALLYDRVRTSAEYSRVIDAIDRQCAAPNTSASPVRVAIVPGFLYREYPSSGADGRMLVEAARRIGWECDVIPVASTGRLRNNGEIILQWLREHDDGRPVVLASISKGGSDIAAALQHPERDAAFRNVVGWVNVCGIVRGSQVVDRTLARWWQNVGFRLLFAARRWDFGAVRDLRQMGGPLEEPFDAPAAMRIVHAVGFPLAAHFTNSRLSAFHRLIGDLGPNDGAIVLTDLLQAPGVIYPVWGADHYLRPRFRTQPLCEALLRYAAAGPPAEDADD